MLTSETLTAIPALFELLPEWDELARQDSCEGFFRSAAWYLCWIRNIRPDAQPLVIVIRDAGRLVGIAPLCRKTFHSCLSAISLGGSDLVCGEYLDILSLPGYRNAVLHKTWHAVQEIRSQWDLWVLDGIRESGLCDSIHNWATENGLRFKIHSDLICPYIELPSTFDRYLATFKRKQRKHLLRSQRILLQECGVEIKKYAQPQELGAAIDKLIQLHMLRWRSVRKVGTLGRTGFRQFLKDLSTTGTGNGSFRLYIMEQGDTPIAAVLNFHSGKSALQFQNGFDPSSGLARHSPGSVLIMHAIENAIAEGLSCYDFLRGAEDYKFRFARRYKKSKVVMIGRTPGARAYLLALDAKQAGQRIRQFLRKPHPLPAFEQECS